MEIYFQTGKTPSEIYRKQREEAAQQEEKKTEFDNLVFWTHAEREVLYKRLDGRVDKMIEGGLFAEIEQMWKVFCDMGGKMEDGGSVDFEKGIWQTIGFKEFLPYLQASPESKTKELRDECTEKMKTATRTYSRTQEKWIRSKLMHAISGSNILLYLLDTSNVSEYNKNAVDPAIKISELFLNGADPVKTFDPKSLSPLAGEMLSPRNDFDLSQNPDQWVKNHCESCGTTTIGSFQWEKHIRSSRHKKVVAKLKKREEVRIFLEKRAAAAAAGEVKEAVKDPAEELDVEGSDPEK